MKRIEPPVVAGEWVEIKSADEIASTLDANGTLDGLPFMAEMIPFCGQRFRVTRRAEKTCVEYPGVTYRMREFTGNDVVLLDTPRCSGAAHDGCQRACIPFWKEEWLRRVPDGAAKAPAPASPSAALTRLVQSKSADGKYFCQSTQLGRATQQISRKDVLAKCIADLRSGSRGFLEMIGLVVRPIWQHYIEHNFGPKLAVGTLTKTPVGKLSLKPGEIVRIKSEQEILTTLDARARNRGLSCDRGMRRFCGGEFQVRNRLDRMISEASGEMKTLEGTVILEGLNCLCAYHVGGCPRGDYMYWREIWLERVG